MLYFKTLMSIYDIYYSRAAILAISAYLEAFQKIADAATNARGKFILDYEKYNYYYLIILGYYTVFVLYMFYTLINTNIKIISFLYAIKVQPKKLGQH